MSAFPISPSFSAGPSHAESDSGRGTINTLSGNYAGDVSLSSTSNNVPAYLDGIIGGQALSGGSGTLARIDAPAGFGWTPWIIVGGVVLAVALWSR